VETNPVQSSKKLIYGIITVRHREGLLADLVAASSTSVKELAIGHFYPRRIEQCISLNFNIHVCLCC